jgi:hypothetical protein
VYFKLQTLHFTLAYPEQTLTAARPSRILTAFPFDYPRLGPGTCSRAMHFSKELPRMVRDGSPDVKRENAFHGRKIRHAGTRRATDSRPARHWAGSPSRTLGPGKEDTSVLCISQTRSGNLYGAPNVKVAESEASRDGRIRRWNRPRNRWAADERGSAKLPGSVRTGFSQRRLVFPGRSVYTVVVNSGV